MVSTPILIACGLILAALIFGLLVKQTWRTRQYLTGISLFLASLVLLLSGLLFILVSVGIHGYKALVREDLAATVYVTPLGVQQFQAKIVRPNTPDTTFAVAGDELYLDARILKWKPIVNVLGLHTAYSLDRITGRYIDLRDEKTKVRTVYALDGEPKPWDLFLLRTRYGFLSPILDVQYGSAAFVPFRDVHVVRIFVGTSGLIARSQ